MMEKDADKKYMIVHGDLWTGDPTYAFSHDGHRYFMMRTFQSDLEAKKAAVSYLANRDIHATVDEIGIRKAADKKYMLDKGATWGGEPTYAFMHDDHLYFVHKPFHSELHAKREAVEWLATRGIHVEVEDIGVGGSGLS